MGTRLKSYRSNSVTTVLNYDDGTQVTVLTWDFNRAFGTIINATKDEVIREYAV